ncbi:hypothetical protein M5K25_001709 [Dendrobium thyrsiflorum]|uniref:G-box binding protein multifunctional mosaic region domain-containing protein n=1 Tax=Dendrobium thyrsiflorum TaxID=117978 RepID=A0ABD0VS42_DENTH
MGNSEADTPSKAPKALAAQEQPSVTSTTPATPVYPDWSTFQAYSPIPPPGFFHSAVGSSPPPHPYIWGAQTTTRNPFPLPSELRRASNENLHDEVSNSVEKRRERSPPTHQHPTTGVSELSRLELDLIPSSRAKLIELRVGAQTRAHLVNELDFELDETWLVT